MYFGQNPRPGVEESSENPNPSHEDLNGVNPTYAKYIFICTLIDISREREGERLIL